MASAGEHHSSSADFPPGTGRHSSPLHLSHSFGGCTNTTVKLQDRILLTQPPLSHRLSFPSNCTRENSLLSLGSNSILSFKPTSECSSINSSMILSFDRDLNGDPKSRKERETRKSSQGSQADQEMYCNEISGCYEQVAESVKERQREEEMGWFCSEDIVGGDGDSQKRPNSGSEGVGSKRHCASNHYKSKSRLTISKDPQSIAAKNRRERISERLRTLQDLVPNGTKVDLVTMLEKAISYVKFLQLQVKVLATDEFWPPHGGKAAELGQVKEAIEAILSSHMQSHS